MNTSAKSFIEDEIKRLKDELAFCNKLLTKINSYKNIVPLPTRRIRYSSSMKDIFEFIRDSDTRPSIKEIYDTFDEKRPASINASINNLIKLNKIKETNGLYYVCDSK